MAFTEDWLQQHRAKMAAHRVAGAGGRVLDRQVDATRIHKGPLPGSPGDEGMGGETVAADRSPRFAPHAERRMQKQTSRTPSAPFTAKEGTVHRDRRSSAGETLAGDRTGGKRKRRTPEQDFQKDCVKFLNAALPPSWRVVHVPNGGTTGGHKAKIIGGIRKAMGVREGFPDLMLVGPSRFVAIELKAAGRRGKVLSTAQEEWRDWFAGVGLPWFLARTIEDVIAACQDAGVPLRIRRLDRSR